MQVSLLTREFPPEVYGGAGVHVEYLARELRDLVDLTVHCFGADRADAKAYRPWDAVRGNAALETMSVDLAMTAGVDGAQLVHSHTWYANLAGHLSKLNYGIPARRDDAQPRAAAPVEGGAARRRLPPLLVLRAHGARGGGRDRRRVRRDARRRARLLPGGRARIAFVSSTTASIRRSTRRTRTRMFSKSTESIRRRRT